MLTILFFTGVLAGLVDSMVGGGGLVSVPALLSFSGLSPAASLATNKLQSSMGACCAVYRYNKFGYLKLGNFRNTILWTALGAFIGAILLRYVSSNILSKAIPVLLTFVWIRNLLGEKKSRWNLNPLPSSVKKIACNRFDEIFGILIGFYDGFFGPGTGVLWTTAFMSLKEMTIKFATAATKVVNMTSNIVSLSVFIALDLVDYEVGLVMGIGNVLGAFLGSLGTHVLPQSLIRRAFLVMTTIILISVFWKEFS